MGIDPCARGGCVCRADAELGFAHTYDFRRVPVVGAGRETKLARQSDPRANSRILQSTGIIIPRASKPSSSLKPFVGSDTGDVVFDNANER